MSAVRVVSYNVLCSHLAPADRFCHCKPNDLAGPVRLKRILKALDVEVAAGAVLCLQEVGREWSGELHKYFSDKGFHFIHSGYGEPYNDYMGVAIACPTNKFDILDTVIKRISESLPPPPTQGGGGGHALGLGGVLSPVSSSRVTASWSIHSVLLQSLQAVYRRLSISVSAFLRFFMPTTSKKKAFSVSEVKCPWVLSRSKRNTCVFLRLRPKLGGSVFCVATYHMPCVFWDQRVMLIHTVLVAQKVQQLAGSDAYILAGDFNFPPSSTSYKLVTEGAVSAADEGYVLPEQQPAATAASLDPLKNQNNNAELDEREKTHAAAAAAAAAGVSCLVHPAEAAAAAAAAAAPAAAVAWRAALRERMSSAYVKANGKEPDFTNYAQIFDDDPFMGTIDYIFVSPTVQVAACKPLIDRTKAQGPFPTEKEPSDHVLIAADLVI